MKELGASFHKLERSTKACEELAGKPLDEDILVIALPASCVPEHRKEISLREDKDEVVRYIGRRRAASSRPVPMNVGN